MFEKSYLLEVQSNGALPLEEAKQISTDLIQLNTYFDRDAIIAKTLIFIQI